MLWVLSLWMLQNQRYSSLACVNLCISIYVWWLVCHTYIHAWPLPLTPFWTADRTEYISAGLPQPFRPCPCLSLWALLFYSLCNWLLIAPFIRAVSSLTWRLFFLATLELGVPLSSFLEEALYKEALVLLSAGCFSLFVQHSCSRPRPMPLWQVDWTTAARSWWACLWL